MLPPGRTETLATSHSRTASASLASSKREPGAPPRLRQRTMMVTMPTPTPTSTSASIKTNQPPPLLDLFLFRRLAASAMAAAVVVTSAALPQDAFASTLPQRSTATTAAEEVSPSSSSSSSPSPSRSFRFSYASQAPPLPTKFPALRSFSLPRVEQATLSNGLRVFYVADTAIGGSAPSSSSSTASSTSITMTTPTARGALLMRGGQRAATPPGVATLATTVQRSGGSKQHPSPGFDEILDDLAASVEAGAAPDASVVSFECLSEDAAEVLSLVGEIVRSPALPEEQLSLAKSQVISILRHRDDSPGAAPAREAARMIYGRGSVFSRNPTVEQVKAIKVGDLENYLRQWQRPDAAVLTLVGDFGSVSGGGGGGGGGRKEAKSSTSTPSSPPPSFSAPPSSSPAARAAFAAAERALGGQQWRVAEGQPPEPPPIPVSPLAQESDWKGKTFLIDRPGAPQASVALALPGVALDDDDAPALDLLSGALNSFGGRLFDGLRTRQGLAYTVSARFDTGQVDHRGLFVAGGSTAKPAEFVRALRRVLRDAAAEGTAPAGEELASAKAEALNSFVFNYADPGSAAARAGAYSLLGLPADYLDDYRSKIERLTDGDVARAAKKHLRADDAVVVVAADARELKKRGGFMDGEVAIPLVVEPVERPSASVTAVGGVVVPKKQS